MLAIRRCPVSVHGASSTVDVRRNCTAAVYKFRDRLNCRRDVFENMALRRPAAMDACQCYPPCSDVTYDSSYSLSTLPPITNEYRTFYTHLFYTHLETFLQEKMSPERRLLLGVGDYDDRTVPCRLLCLSKDDFRLNSSR